MQRSVQIVIYAEGDLYVAQCLNVDVASDGATPEEARENLRQALELFLDEPDADVNVLPIGEPHIEQLTLKSA